MTYAISLLDPGTPEGAVFTGVFVGVITLVIGGIGGWFLGPLKWYYGNRRLKRFIRNHRFFLVFNPDSPAKQRKLVTFQPNGLLGEGRNNNEYSWHTKRGCLEILGRDKIIYSRFRFAPSTGQLVHTNDEDTRSIRGQYFEVIWQRASKPADAVPGGRRLE